MPGIMNDDISDEEFEQMMERCSFFSEHDRICLQMERSLWSINKINAPIIQNETNKIE